MTPEERDRLVRLEEQTKQVLKDLHAIREVTDNLKTQSLYVRGGLILMIAVGSIFAWIANVWGSIK